MGWIVALASIAVVGLLIILAFGIKKGRAKKLKDGQKPEKKERKPLFPKMKKMRKNENGKLDTKGSYCDTIDKFLYRKEIKVYVLINKVLPKGYIAFPKISLKSILEPVGSHALYDAVKSKVVDIVIFDRETMKPKAVVDIFDGSIGDEQLDTFSPVVVDALKSAELPIISIKVKTDYDPSEIEKQIFEALGLNYNQNEDDGNEKTDE